MRTQNSSFYKSKSKMHQALVDGFSANVFGFQISTVITELFLQSRTDSKHILVINIAAATANAIKHRMNRTQNLNAQK